MCRVTQCCCGASLETGCKILAILGLIGGGIGLAQGVIGLVADASAIVKIVTNLCAVIAAALLLWGTLKRKPTPVLAYLIFQAISMALMMVFIVLMVVGMVWAGSVAADEIAAGKYDLDGNDGNLSNEDAAHIARSATTVIAVLSAVVYAIAWALSIYFWIVVYSFYRELKDGEGRVGHDVAMTYKA